MASKTASWAGAGPGAQSAERLPSRHEPLLPFQAWRKVGVIENASHPSTQEVQARGSAAQGHPWPPSEVEASWAT